MELKFSNISCATCGTIFWMQENLQTIRQKDGKNFSCPNGHKNVYDAEKIDQAARVAELEAEVKKLRIEKAQLLHKLEQANIV